MPTSAIAHIQNTAPGPPIPTATATAPGSAQRWKSPNQGSTRAPSQAASPTSSGVHSATAAAK